MKRPWVGLKAIYTALLILIIEPLLFAINALPKSLLIPTILAFWGGLNIPKPPQNAEFSASQGLNIKALLCRIGRPFQEVATMRVCPCETPMGWFKSDLYCVIDINNRTTIICHQCLA